MISVVIPTYNRADMVVEAVRSVIGQEEVPDEVEIIVVDDGSTDGTERVVEAFSDRVAYHRLDRRGVSAARNFGIDRSRGDIIAFLDSDDLWLPGKLAAQMEYFRENPDILICQTEELWIRNGKRLNPKRYHKKPRGDCFPLLLERCLVSPSAVAIRRELFDEVGLFDESLPACEDYDLWLRVGCRYALGLIDKPLIIKRGGHADQLSATVPALDRYRIISIRKLLRSGLLDAEKTEAAMRVLQMKVKIYAEGCRKRGRPEEALSIENMLAEVVPNP